MPLFTSRTRNSSGEAPSWPLSAKATWTGIISMPACEAAGVEWYAVEQDICRRDPFDCLQSSYTYLTEFAHVITASSYAEATAMTTETIANSVTTYASGMWPGACEKSASITSCLKKGRKRNASGPSGVLDLEPPMPPMPGIPAATARRHRQASFRDARTRPLRWSVSGPQWTPRSAAPTG